ncbi:MAG: ABC transporter ATP-binding protein, partial [Bacilli bacterium]|nr:ABC transporter ATP-binding protein [Bacilli bacterium]
MKIFKNLTRRDVIFIFLMIITILSDVYFELKMPEFTSKLATSVQSGTAIMQEVLDNGLKMLGCA